MRNSSHLWHTGLARSVGRVRSPLLHMPKFAGDMDSTAVTRVVSRQGHRTTGFAQERTARQWRRRSTVHGKRFGTDHAEAVVRSLGPRRQGTAVLRAANHEVNVMGTPVRQRFTRGREPWASVQDILRRPRPTRIVYSPCTITLGPNGSSMEMRPLHFNCRLRVTLTGRVPCQTGCPLTYSFLFGTEILEADEDTRHG